jgi:hypothetical protein
MPANATTRSYVAVAQRYARALFPSQKMRCNKLRGRSLLQGGGVVGDIRSQGRAILDRYVFAKEGSGIGTDRFEEFLPR